MPVRRLNFTGRKRISRDYVQLSVTSNGAGYELRARFDLQHYSFPAKARIHLEAYKRTSFQRFDFGTISKQLIPTDMALSSFSSPQGMKYRLKIVDAEKNRGRILGEVDNLKAVIAEDVDGAEESLLPVEPSHELGHELYRLEFGTNEIHLLVNAELANWQEVIKGHFFSTLVFPNLLRQVLLHILRFEEHRVIDDPTDWRSQWLKFAIEKLRARPIPDDGNLDDDHVWVDECVKSFCQEHRILSRFNQAWGDG